MPTKPTSKKLAPRPNKFVERDKKAISSHKGMPGIHRKPVKSPGFMDARSPSQIGEYE